MRDKRPFEEDFAGLDEVEAEELGELAESLASDRFEPDDPNYWSQLQQSILNEVAVTPRPVVERSRLARLWSWLSGGAGGRVVLAAVATALLGVLVHSLVSIDGEAPLLVSHDLGQSDAARTQEDANAVAHHTPIVIPEELWSDGFLAYRQSWLDKELLDESVVEQGEDTEDWSDEEVLPFGVSEPLWAYVSDAELEAATAVEADENLTFDTPFEMTDRWGLGDLTEEELLALERTLDG